MSNVGLVGIGDLGFAVAKNLIGRGYDVVGYRRSPMDAFAAEGGKPAASPREVAERARVVFTCLPTSEALIDVVSGEQGLAAAQEAELTVFELSTIQVSDKEHAAKRLKDAGGTMLDCSVSGNPNYLKARTAVLFASGSRTAFESHIDVLEAITNNVRYVGDFGSGTALKLVASALIPIHTVAAAEALALATRAGLDRRVVFDAIKGTPASSGMFESRGVMMVDRNYPPSAGIGAYMKNVEMAVELAEKLGGEYPLITAMRNCYKAAIAEGLGSADQSAIFEYLIQKTE